MKKCTDPAKQSRLGLAIVLAGAQGYEAKLSPELRKHLEECDSCRESLPLWQEKAKATSKAKQSYDIVNKAASGDPNILRRSGALGTAFFKPDQDGVRGLLVFVTSDNVIRDPEEITWEEFNRLAV